LVGLVGWLFISV